MKIFFGCSTSKYPRYRDHYWSIRNYLVDQGHVLTRDWLEMYKDYLDIQKETTVEANNSEGREWYDKAVRAVFNSDMVILEDTVSSFSNGHLMSLALPRRIPVLVLWIEKQKKSYLKRKFIHGIHSNYLQISGYNLENYQNVIGGFIKKYSNATEKHRFHLVIDEVERNYLEWAKFNKGKSRTKIIRGALRNEMDKDDDFQRYLAQ